MAINGIDTANAANYTSQSKTKNDSALDKNAFLQLLVTQMQHQDPLSPTDNTEYMSQLAQFSEMEAMNNLNTSFSNSQALGLVGQYVLLNTTDAAGNLKQVGGLVQYVTVVNNQALLRVNDEYYTMDEFDSVVDWDYVEFLNNQNAAGDVENTGDQNDEVGDTETGDGVTGDDDTTEP